MLPLELFNGVNRANVRMVQRRRRPRLPLKPFDQLRVLRHFRRQEFHRHAPSQPRIFRLVSHHTHAAAAYFPCDFVV